MALGDVVGNDAGTPATPQQPPGQTVLATHATLAEALLERDRDRSYVVVMHDYEPEGRYPVGPEPLTVGRDAARDIVVPDVQVSRLDLQVVAVGSDLVVEDLGSSNGTLLGRAPNQRAVASSRG